MTPQPPAPPSAAGCRPMQPTPRTDSVRIGPDHPHKYWEDFARQLERELAATTAELGRLSSLWDRLADEHYRACSQMPDRDNYEQVESIACTYQRCAQQLRAAAQPVATRDTAGKGEKE